MEKESCTKFCGVLIRFLEVENLAQVKFSMIKRYLDVSDVIHAKEYTKDANCGLHLNCWIFLFMAFCFIMKKDHFKQKLLIWPQVPFMDFFSNQFHIF